MKKIWLWFVALDNTNKVALIIALLGMLGSIFTYFSLFTKEDSTDKDSVPVVKQIIIGDGGTPIGINNGEIYIGSSSQEGK